ncbi:hypothetical protein BNJ_00137 [Kaumoebavirus]|uniref:hypothetical protein n=1 Tax=Kaumoebavirus TaxID=1859492 RepID=UPI0009C33C4A|nr:hypothetical protein BNJ_00137 [Kaumoebavirus]ARA71969.1 hypothetical protein BNJ_00137 [Kaumoebavirus]
MDEKFEKLVKKIVLPFLTHFYIDDRVIINKPKDLVTTVYVCSPFGSQTTFSLYTNIYKEYYIKVEGPGRLGPKYTSPLITSDLGKIDVSLRNCLAFLDFEKDLSDKISILNKVKEIRESAPEHLRGLTTLEFLENI